MEFIIDDDEPSIERVGEVESRAITDTPEVGLLTIPVHEYSAKPQASQRMLDDAGFDIEGWLNGKVSRKIGREENTDFVTGDGSKKAKGFLSYDAWTVAGTYERDALEQRTGTGTAGTLDQAKDFIKLQTDLIEDYQQSAVWTMRRKSWASILELQDENGQFLLRFGDYMRSGTDLLLLGKPVNIMADMPAIANNSLSVAYGDFGMGYTIVDRFGIRVLRDPYSNKPYVQFYTTKRTGGAVTNFEAIKILKTPAT
jgi:HK97 family phage major capsid protein